MSGSSSTSNSNPADREPKIATDGDSFGPLKPVIATDTVSLAVLERLNRQSIIHILEEVVREIDHHCQRSGTKSTVEVDKLRLEVLALLTAQQQRIEKNSSELQQVNQQITELRGHMNQQKDSQIQTLRIKLNELETRFEQLRVQRRKLGPREVKQIEQIIHKVPLGQLSVTVHQRRYVLAELLDVLASADSVADTHLEYSELHISRARLVLTDHTEVTFTCSFCEEQEGRLLRYEFHTPDWKGLAASFSMLFARRQKTTQLCGRPRTLTTYDGVHYSNITFDLVPKACPE